MPFSFADLTLPTRHRSPVAGLLAAALLSVAALIPASSIAQAAPIAAPAEEARGIA